jgi:hypothetical protein
LALQWTVAAIWLVGGSIVAAERMLSDEVMGSAVSDVFADCTITEVEIAGDVRERYRCPDGDEGLLD